MAKKIINDLSIKGQRVFIRVDFNVPLQAGKVDDDTRIRAALPTIKYAIQQGAKVILASHLGRPKGKPVPEMSLRPVAGVLAEMLGKPVICAPDCIGPQVESLVTELKPGEVLLLENLRFYSQEEKNDPEFSKKLAALAEVYINDAFGCAHRAHASVAGMVKYLSNNGIGFLMEKEIKFLGNLLEAPRKPFVAILGGAKVSTKVNVITKLFERADTILIGGGLAYTFHKAMGLEIGHSLVENDMLDTANNILNEAKAKGVNMVLSCDVVAAEKLEPHAATTVYAIDNIPKELEAFDVGPKTLDVFGQYVKTAGTIFWNGPMGVFEVPGFEHGTFKLASLIGQSSAVSVIGGGDSVSAIQKSGLADQFDHLSTGGGASLEFLEGIELPGIAVINDK